MKYGSVCSGVEAASLAWINLGWECKFLSEVEPFPCTVLQERWGASSPINPLNPNDVDDPKEKKQRELWLKVYKYLKKEGAIPNEGDFTQIGDKYRGEIDLLVGGTPCQDLSISGCRTGLQGKRSSLAIDFVRLAYESQCKWFIWENVPNALNTNKGRDFATLLSLFTGCKIEVPKDGFKKSGFVCNARRDRFGVAWRIMDAEYTRTQLFPFAVPQHRRRLFIVGYFGDWSRAAEVLLEPEGLSRSTPSRIRAREEVAKFLREHFHETIGELPRYLRQTLGAYWRILTQSSSLVNKSHSIGNGQPDSIVPQPEIAWALHCMHDQQAILHTINCYENHSNDCRIKEMGSVCQKLNSQIGTGGNNLPLCSFKKDNISFVRRFTPVECERLMGFPDNYTKVSYRGKHPDDCPDNARYKACGNSMCVNVMEWLGTRIQFVEEKYNKIK